MVGYDFLSVGKDIKYSVAIYIRLSCEDALKQEESLSVTNQKNVLEAYVREQGYELYDVYIDDGFTGTNFNRPGFIRMIRDIEDGKVNMVVTKDLSRLGRDYIETGEYVEKYFPMHHVRYVALLDGIDTFYDQSNNDIAPFKAVINDMYSRDNSKKIRTALKSMQREGKWVGGCPPFGYMVDAGDKNHLVPNEEEAKIVKSIFRYAYDGFTYYQIAEKLSLDRIPTCSMLRCNNRGGKMAIRGYWSARTVKGILSNELYVGDMVQNKNTRISYKVRKNIKNVKEDWIVVKNTHEALVDREVFYDIQKLLLNSRIRGKRCIYRLLDGLLYCYDCGHKIMICSPNKRGYTYIVCNYYRMYSKNKLCTSHSFNYDKLENMVICAFIRILEKCVDRESILKKVFSYYCHHCVKGGVEEQIKQLDSTISSREEYLDKMYFDRLDGRIDDIMFDRIKEKVMGEIKELQNKKSNLLSNSYDEVYFNKKCYKMVNDLFEINNWSRSFMLKFIRKIDIHNDKTLDVYFCFKKPICG